MSHHSDTRMRIIMIIKRINRTNRIEWLPLRDTHCSGLLFQGQASRTEVLVPLVYSVYSGVHLHRTAHRLNSPALLPAFSFFLFPIFSSHPFSVGHPASFLLFLFSVCFSLFLPLSLSLSLCVCFFLLTPLPLPSSLSPRTLHIRPAVCSPTGRNISHSHLASLSSLPPSSSSPPLFSLSRRTVQGGNPPAGTFLHLLPVLYIYFHPFILLLPHRHSSNFHIPSDSDQSLS